MDAQRKKDLMSDRSPGRVAAQKLTYELVQCQERVEGPKVVTLFPEGKPVTYMLTITPLRLQWEGWSRCFAVVATCLPHRVIPVVWCF